MTISTRVGLPLRVAAAGIDALVASALGFALVLAFHSWSPTASPSDYWVFAAFGFATAGELFTGRSVGRLALRLRVARADGDRATVPRLLARWLAKYLPLVLVLVHETMAPHEWRAALSPLVPVLFAVMVLSLLPAVARHRQTAYDLLCRTAVWRDSAEARGFAVVTPAPPAGPPPPV